MGAAKAKDVQANLISAAIRTILAATAALLGCVEQRGAGDECVDLSAHALTRGGANPPIPLSEAEQAAIGAIENEDGSLICTGSVIADGWVLAAGHCHGEASAWPWFRSTLKSGEIRLPVVNVIRHPEVDAALFAIPKTNAISSGEMVPLAIWHDQPVGLGDRLTLCGYGDTEDGSDGTLLFLEEEVVEVSDAAITVDGGTEYGACSGDSGGPLLATGRNGTVGIVGILLGGDQTCVGSDLYLRARFVSDWVNQVLEERAHDPCGEITWDGHCSTDRAQWCEDDKIIVAKCSNDDVCGWDVKEQGFRCVDYETDPCKGIGSVGVCRGVHWVTCKRGIQTMTDCSACGRTCKMDAEYAGCE